MELREGLFRVPKDLPKLPNHAEAGERVYHAYIGLVKRLLRLQGIKVTVVGAENIPQFGGALMAANHTGYYDFIFAGAAPYLRGRRLARFMAKKSIFEVPVLKWFLKPLRHVPVDRAAGAGAIDAAVDHLRSGRLVTIFPEATISRSYEIKPLKNGAARIATAARVPLIPIAIWGSQRIWTKNGKRNLGRSNIPVFVYVGKPVTLTDDPDEDTNSLREAMKSLLERARKEYAQEFGPFEQGLDWLPAAQGGLAPTLEQANEMDAQDRQARIEARQEKELKAAEHRAEKAEKKLAKRARKAWRKLKRKQ